MAVRRNTNSIRRGVMASLPRNGEAWKTSQALAWRIKRLADHPCVWRRNVRKGRRDKRGDLCTGVTVCRSRSPHSTESGESRPQIRATQTGWREGGQEGECVKYGLNDQQAAASLPATASQAASNPAAAGHTPVGESHAWEWVDREIWMERMLAAQVTASSKGNKCLLRGVGTVHHEHSPANSEPTPMRTSPTGEPCAGEPHARFGGRGGSKPSLPLQHSHRGCLSGAPAGRAASSSVRPGGEHHRSVGAFSARPRRCEPPPGTACRDARQRQGSPEAYVDQGARQRQGSPGAQSPQRCPPTPR
jgi:hypothetical protein